MSNSVDKTPIVNGSSIIARIVDGLKAAARWWTGEASRLVPDRVVKRFSPPARSELRIRLQGGDVLLELCRAGTGPTMVGIPGRQLSERSLDDFLVAHGLGNQAVLIGLGLPKSSIFSREFRLPTVAADRLADIVEQDLARRLPFKRADIWHHFHSTRDDRAGQLIIDQWIVRRELVERELHALGLQPARIDFVFEQSSDGHARTISIKSIDRRQRPLLAQGLLALAGLALVLLAALPISTYRQHVRRLSDLDAQIAEIKPKALRVRTAIEEIEQHRSAIARLRTMKASHVGFLQTWLELTRLLPDHTWLTEVRFRDDLASAEAHVGIVGFSDQAAGLVGLVERSALLGKAITTSPITLDPEQHKERFAIETSRHASPSGVPPR